jgi:hypothetical protein
MRKFLASIALSMTTACVHAQTTEIDVLSSQSIAAASDATPSIDASNSSHQTSLPPGIITEQNSLKLAIIEQQGAKKAYYRPNESMPDLSNEDALRGRLSSGRTQEQARRELVGYMPRLRIIPCSDNCNSSAYDEAAAALIKGYRGTMPNVAERGEMIVRISHFHHLSFLASMVPTFNESISIQFVLQGRLVTLDKAAMDNHGSATDMAEQLGALLGTQVLMQLGVGIAPSVTIPASKTALNSAKHSVLKVGSSILNVVGTDSAHSTIGPVPDGDISLLPAIDGIGPNEIEPLTETTEIE